MRPLVVVLIGTLVLALPLSAVAHTDTDFVAVSAGEEVTIELRPQHGCGDSPTTTVSVRAPVPDATAGPIDGWQASSTPDGEGNTILEWTGGVLLADQPGEFPVVFVAPDAVGELLLFPAVQRCENGEELAWISGDPAAEFPAPRLLILAPGSPPAATIDDVPLDAPGRDQLEAIVDVDNPAAPETTIVAGIPDSTPDAAPLESDPSDTTGEAPAASEPAPVDSVIAEVSPASSAVTAAADSESDGGGSTVLVIAIIAVIVAIVAGVVIVRRRG